MYIYFYDITIRYNIYGGQQIDVKLTIANNLYLSLIYYTFPKIIKPCYIKVNNGSLLTQIVFGYLII